MKSCTLFRSFHKLVFYYLKDVKLKIRALRRGPQDRVIRPLGPGLNLPEPHMGLPGRLAQHLLKELPCHKMRA